MPLLILSVLRCHYSFVLYSQSSAELGQTAVTFALKGPARARDTKLKPAIEKKEKKKKRGLTSEEEEASGEGEG